MNWKRGLFRAAIVLSVIWVIAAPLYRWRVTYYTGPPFWINVASAAGLLIVVWIIGGLIYLIYLALRRMVGSFRRKV